MKLIPLMKPRLPNAEALVKYIKQIDELQIYSNNGPLVVQLETRLAGSVNKDCSIVTGSNATLLLTALIKASLAKNKNLVAVPGWTFCATVESVILAGYEPYICDVDQSLWAITPSSIPNHIKSDLAGVVAVLPFGDVSALPLWEKFHDETGIPVVIDAATAFDKFKGSNLLPGVVSMHATKVLPAAEGAFLIAPSKSLAESVRSMCAFGFQQSSEASIIGFNAKLSEYHAAIALASLEQWSKTREELMRIQSFYRETLSDIDDLVVFSDVSKIASMTMLVQSPRLGKADDVSYFLENGIAVKRWWGPAICDQQAFKDINSTPQINSRKLASEVLGLPFYLGMTEADVILVCNILAQYLTKLR